MKGIWTSISTVIYSSVTLQTKKLAKKQVLSSIFHPPSYLHQISCLLWLHLALIQRSVTRNNELTPHGAAWKCRRRLVGFWWWKTRMVREESGGVFYLLNCLLKIGMWFSDYSWRDIEMLFCFVCASCCMLEADENSDVRSWCFFFSMSISIHPGGSAVWQMNVQAWRGIDLAGTRLAPNDRYKWSY